MMIVAESAIHGLVKLHHLLFQVARLPESVAVVTVTPAYQYVPDHLALFVASLGHAEVFVHGFRELEIKFPESNILRYPTKGRTGLSQQIKGAVRKVF